MKALLTIIAVTGFLSLSAGFVVSHATRVQAQALKVRMISLEDLAMLDALADRASTSCACFGAAGGIQLAAGLLGLLVLRKSDVRRRKAFVLASFAALFLPLSAAADLPPTALLPRAHAHNDYEHARPLLDALDNGFCSVEADVWLVDGKLLVAHNLADVKSDRTLEALYLQPLFERTKRNGGRVFAGGPSVTLLIDFKSEAAETYRALAAALKPYAPMLTVYREARTETNAVSIILSGNTPRDALKAEKTRLAAYDGRPNELDANVSPQVMPLVSDAWGKHFKWRGRGPFPADERAKLQSLADRVHGQGKRIRFWGAPDSPEGWAALLGAGVDVIGTDRLEALRAFLAQQPEDR